MDSHGKQESAPRVALKDTHGDVINVTVSSSCGDGVGVEGVKVSDKARVSDRELDSGRRRTETYGGGR